MNPPTLASSACRLCRENATAVGRKICDECYANAGDYLERYAEQVAAAPALKDALEAVLDLWLDGRVDALDRREEEVLRMADDALTAATAIAVA